MSQRTIGKASRITSGVIASSSSHETLGAARSALPTSGTAGCYQLVDEAGECLADAVADDGGGGVVEGRGVAVDDDQAGIRLIGNPA
jgi:hypothetical protein